MDKPPPAKFSPEQVMLMRSALNTAVDRIDRSHRTPATKAKMAQRIVRTASEGVTDLQALTSAAVDEGACQRSDDEQSHAPLLTGWTPSPTLVAIGWH